MSLFDNHKDILAQTRGVIIGGANEGQEIPDFLSSGVKRMLLFEPEPEPFAILARYASPQIHAFNLALSDSTGAVTFYSTDHTQASSLLEPNPHFISYLGAKTVEVITVQAVTLDEFFRAHLAYHPSDYNMLFLDTQGSEDKVLRGAKGILASAPIDFIWLEVSHSDLYVGMPRHAVVNDLLESLGFKMVALYNNGHLTYGDALYKRIA